MGNSRPCFHVDGQTKYSRLQGHALYLMEPARRSVLWTIKIDWNNHRRSISNTIDAFEPSRKTNGRNTTRDTIKWFCSMIMLDPMLRKWSRHTWKRWWKVLPHPPYSPDVAPSDYHLFSMTHGLADQHFRSYEEVKNWINSWIASKDQFFRRGIRTLPERWEKVVASDGQYFES